MGSISFQRPDLFPSYNSFLNIPLNPPKLFEGNISYANNLFIYLLIYFIESGAPEVGELMLASFTMDVNFISSISKRNSWYFIYFN